MKKVLIYHHYDQDGYLSASIIKSFYKCLDDEVRCIVGNYKEKFPKEEMDWADIIYILDYSIPAIYMADYADKVVWLDHHASGMQALTAFEYVDGKREIGKSGCLLTWKFLYPDKEPPYVVKLVNDRDVWIWKYGYISSAFHEASMSFVKDYERWQELLNSDFLTGQEVDRGKIILEHTHNMVDNYNKQNAWAGTFEGYSVMFLNGSSMISGEMHKRLREQNPDAEFAVLFTVVRDEVGIGLYRRDGSSIDMSVIAKAYGGGGHAGAAGFYRPISDLEMILSGGMGIL